MTNNLYSKFSKVSVLKKEIKAYNQEEICLKFSQAEGNLKTVLEYKSINQAVNQEDAETAYIFRYCVTITISSGYFLLSLALQTLGILVL